MDNFIDKIFDYLEKTTPGIMFYDENGEPVGLLLNADALDILPRFSNIDLVVSDPPYKLISGGNTGSESHKKMAGGWLDEYDNSGNLFIDCPDWAEFVPLIYNCLKPKSHCYLMADSKNQFDMQLAARNAGFKFHQLLYWDKGTCTPNKYYMKNAEYTGFFYKENTFTINNPSSKQGIYIPQNDETKHPTEKPELLFEHYITNSSQPGDVVLDPFAGSGTLAISAMRAGRRFICIEKDPKWFEVARKRIYSFIENKEHQKNLF